MVTRPKQSLFIFSFSLTYSFSLSLHYTPLSHHKVVQYLTRPHTIFFSFEESKHNIVHRPCTQVFLYFTDKLSTITHFYIGWHHISSQWLQCKHQHIFLYNLYCYMQSTHLFFFTNMLLTITKLFTNNTSCTITNSGD
jgi:hypothetical protein